MKLAKQMFVGRESACLRAVALSDSSVNARMAGNRLAPMMISSSNSCLV